MITSDHQKLIIDAVASNERTRVKAVCKKVIHEELGSSRNIDNITLNYFDDLVEHISIPVRVTFKGENKCEVADCKEEQKCIILSTVSLLCIWIVSSFINHILGLVMAGSILGIAIWLKKTRRKSVEAQTSSPIVLEEIIEAQEVIDMVDSIVTNIRHALNKNIMPVPQQQMALHECYPNILKWIHKLYADSSDFDEKTRKHIQKRIESVTDQCYYKIVEYDGSNSNMFELSRQIGLEKPIMVSPAFVYEKNGNVVVPGDLFIPANS